MERSSFNGERFYVHPVTAEPMPSVTTILGSAGVSRGLMAWAAKMAAEFAVDEMQQWLELDREAAIKLIKGTAFRHSGRSLKVGTDAHAYAEDRLNGMARHDDKAARIMSGGGDHACDNVDKLIEGTGMKPILTEVGVYHDELMYAGTFDGVVEIDGRLLLIDWKTSRSVVGDMALQLAAYRYGLYIDGPDGIDLMPKVDGCAVLHIPKEGPAALVELRAEELDFEAFQHYLGIYHWKKLREPAAIMHREVYR
jgi:hypothetical protein